MTDALSNSARYSLMFGRNIGTLRTVSDEEIDNFLTTVVARQLGSFTVTHSVGYWEGTREESFTISVCGDYFPVRNAKPLSRPNEQERLTLDLIGKLKSMAAVYCHDFDQDAVGLVIEPLQEFRLLSK